MSSPNNEQNYSQNTTEQNLKSSITSLINISYLKSIHFLLKILIIVTS